MPTAVFPVVLAKLLQRRSRYRLMRAVLMTAVVTVCCEPGSGYEGVAV